MSGLEYFLALFQPTLSAVMTGTGFYLWLGNLSKVKKFAKIELERGVTAE